LFLPDPASQRQSREFDEFYAPEMRIIGQIIRPAVEDFLFGFLNAQRPEIERWSVARCYEYLDDLPRLQIGTTSSIVKAVLSSANPGRAVRNLLAQFSVDFLSEGSAIARKVMGNFGEVQSNLFRIFIDEYGGGVHSRKHSTLFERLLQANGMDCRPCAYWNYTLAASFGVPNLFQCLAANHREFFRYVGAVYYAETTYYHFCQQISGMLKHVFGAGAETEYFDEHYQVDQQHSRIAFDELVRPLIKRFDATAARGIVLGYEAFRIVSELFDDAFVLQLRAIDGRGMRTVRADKLPLDAVNKASYCRLQKPANFATTSTTEDHSVLYLVREGAMDLSLGLEAQVGLEAGEGVIVPKCVLHWLDGPDSCVYERYQVEQPDQP
jgi:mannose-6-phosphate isomerase-like protein (cupin superfamily)